MEPHFEVILLKKSVVSAFVCSIVLVEDKVFWAGMWNLLDQIIDVIWYRDISCGLLSFITLLNNVVSVDAYPCTSNFYKSTVIVLEDITKLETTNLRDSHTSTPNSK